MRILFLVLALATITTANSQESKKNPLYGHVGLFWGNYFGPELGINYIKDDTYSFQISYYNHAIEAKEKPGDFNSSTPFGWSSTFLFPDLEIPDTNHSFNLLGGYIYNLNPKGTIRLNLQAGIAFIHTRYITNFEKKSAPPFFGDNYDYDSKYRNTLAIIINPKIDFPFFKGYGLSVSPLFQIGRKSTVFGVGVFHIFGRTRNKIENTAQPVEEATD